ncbi:MAG TPA: methylenetetrahydrofolate reductase [Acidimicrobiales bacterium]|nr:methylenetetrahydrofolate reductase [Acidimicrobiales bacterium]
MSARPTGAADRRFSVVCEVQPPTRPGLGRVQEQVRALSNVASAFVVPDSHIGRATVSSIAVAHEVQRLGVRSVACLNSRDRNVLGFRRDLLTAATYGIDQLLCVYGDRPSAGGRTGDLNVQAMIEEVRSYGSGRDFASSAPFSVGVAARLGPFPRWKQEADFVFSQVTFSMSDLFAWRDSLRFDGPVYAGVLVLRSARSAAGVAGIDVPADLAERVAADPVAGIEEACEQVRVVMDHGGFAGVHLIPLGPPEELARRLEATLSGLRPVHAALAR